MRNQITLEFVSQRKSSDVEQNTESCFGRKLEVSVIFTSPAETLAALKTAGSLADQLGDRVRLIGLQVVPFAYALNQPPVSVDFTEKRLFKLACEAALDSQIIVQPCVCRDKVPALLKLLEPNSLVVIGAKKRWWPTAESRLAKTLRAQGHQVILMEFK